MVLGWEAEVMLVGGAITRTGVGASAGVGSCI